MNGQEPFRTYGQYVDPTPTAVGHAAYHNVGQVDQSTAWTYATRAAIGAAAYHGYRRSRSVGWAIGWAVLAAISPVIVVGVAVAQGFGKQKGR